MDESPEIEGYFIFSVFDDNHHCYGIAVTLGNCGLMLDKKPFKFVYVASPYSIGNKVDNVYRSIRVGENLIKFGYLPFLPLLAHYWDEVSPHDHEFWLNAVMPWIARCDAVLRLPGKSKGADLEVVLAEQLKVAVFRNIPELLKSTKGMILSSQCTHRSSFPILVCDVYTIVKCVACSGIYAQQESHPELFYETQARGTDRLYWQVDGKECVSGSLEDVVK